MDFISNVCDRDDAACEPPVVTYYLNPAIAGGVSIFSRRVCFTVLYDVCWAVVASTVRPRYEDVEEAPQHATTLYEESKN